MVVFCFCLFFLFVLFCFGFFARFVTRVRASAGNELFSLLTLFIRDDITDGHFRKICCCLYCFKSSLFLLPSLKLFSAVSSFGYPGEIAFLFQKNLQLCPGHVHNEKLFCNFWKAVHRTMKYTRLYLKI